jgi:hypothetical protein
MEGATQAMPQYQCHKTVWALKILRVDPDPTRQVVSEAARLLTFVEPGYAPIRVEEAYVRKHNPQAGGYYVLYEDGYVSFSPAQVFEAGYTRI